MKIIVDTGPLVALLNRRDGYHRWAREVFEQLEPPFLVCDAVLTEASHFLGDSKALREAWLADELQVSFDSAANRSRICQLIQKYRPMDFADACLVVMAELHEPATVVTIDRRDFSRYRVRGRYAIPLILP